MDDMEDMEPTRADLAMMGLLLMVIFIISPLVLTWHGLAALWRKL